MIQIILTSICASIFFNTIHLLHVKWRINFKPFSCASCLASWVGVSLWFAPQLIVDLATALFVSGVLSALLEKYLEKIQ